MSISINKLFKPNYKFSNYPINNRSKLDTGTQCNYKCSFCYYIDKLDVLKSFKDIKKDIYLIHASGITEIDLSGGESSIHPNWFEILQECNIFNHISTLSNGSKFCDIEFLQKSIDFGLKEILFSLHGWDEESHDRITRIPNSFRNILEAINNSIASKLITRLNCTIDSNFNEKEYVELIKKLNISQLNFLPMNYWGLHHQKRIDYKIISKKIQYCLDQLNKYIPEITVRYIPFCYMIGYEKYVVGTYQHIFDLKDWNLQTYNLKSLKPINKENSFEVAYHRRNLTYIKNKECLTCKFLYICDGVEKELIDNFIFLPQIGEYITDVCYYKS
jgi:radical SAM protein with 4Fe4S-binding SPASM domain